MVRFIINDTYTLLDRTYLHFVCLASRKSCSHRPNATRRDGDATLALAITLRWAGFRPSSCFHFLSCFLRNRLGLSFILVILVHVGHFDIRCRSRISASDATPSSPESAAAAAAAFYSPSWKLGYEREYGNIFNGVLTFPQIFDDGFESSVLVDQYQGRLGADTLDAGSPSPVRYRRR